MCIGLNWWERTCGTLRSASSLATRRTCRTSAPSSSPMGQNSPKSIASLSSRPQPPTTRTLLTCAFLLFADSRPVRAKDPLLFKCSVSDCMLSLWEQVFERIATHICDKLFAQEVVERTNARAKRATNWDTALTDRGRDTGKEDTSFEGTGANTKSHCFIF